MLATALAHAHHQNTAIPWQMTRSNFFARAPPGDVALLVAYLTHAYSLTSMARYRTSVDWRATIPPSPVPHRHRARVNLSAEPANDPMTPLARWRSGLCVDARAPRLVITTEVRRVEGSSAHAQALVPRARTGDCRVSSPRRIGALRSTLGPPGQVPHARRTRLRASSSCFLALSHRRRSSGCSASEHRWTTARSHRCERATREGQSFEAASSPPCTGQLGEGGGAQGRSLRVCGLRRGFGGTGATAAAAGVSEPRAAGGFATLPPSLDSLFLPAAAGSSVVLRRMRVASPEAARAWRRTSREEYTQQRRGRGAPPLPYPSLPPSASAPSMTAPVRVRPPPEVQSPSRVLAVLRRVWPRRSGHCARLLDEPCTSSKWPRK